MAELDLQADPREIIALMWPEHVKHLSPPGNKMGGGKIDPDEGVVCNCGWVLGFPVEQDEAEYVAAEPEQPDTSGAQTGEPDDDRDMPAGWQDAAAAGWAENPVGQAYAKGVDDDGEPGWTPQQTEREHDRIDAMEARDRDAEMRERFERNPFDPEAHAYVKGGPDSLTAPDDEANQPTWGEVPGSWAPARDPQTGLSIEQAQAYEQGEPKGVMPRRDSGVVDAEDPITARVVVIDPSRPYTPQDVEHQLLDIASRIERGVHYQRYWEERHFAAKATYTQKAARERLKASGGAKDMRDAAVTVACAEEWTELELCEAMVRAVRETMHNLRSLQSGYQTVARSVTESMRVPAGSRGRP